MSGVAQADAIRERYIAALEDENETLRERVRQLETLLGSRQTIPLIFGLTAHEERLIGMLLVREHMSRTQLLESMYGHLPAGDEPGPKIIDVWVCKMRQKLKPFGIKVQTKWGSGYYLDKEGKARLQKYLEAEGANG